MVGLIESCTCCCHGGTGWHPLHWLAPLLADLPMADPPHHPPAWHENMMDSWGARPLCWLSVLVELSERKAPVNFSALQFCRTQQHNPAVCTWYQSRRNTNPRSGAFTRTELWAAVAPAVKSTVFHWKPLKSSVSSLVHVPCGKDTQFDLLNYWSVQSRLIGRNTNK